MLLPYAIAVLHDLDHVPEPSERAASPMPDIDAVDLLDEMVRVAATTSPPKFRQRGSQRRLIETPIHA